MQNMGNTNHGLVRYVNPVLVFSYSVELRLLRLKKNKDFLELVFAPNDYMDMFA